MSISDDDNKKTAPSQLVVPVLTKDRTFPAFEVAALHGFESKHLQLI